MLVAVPVVPQSGDVTKGFESHSSLPTVNGLPYNEDIHNFLNQPGHANAPLRYFTTKGAGSVSVNDISVS